jgi:hypothetical protein
MPKSISKSKASHGHAKTSSGTKKHVGDVLGISRARASELPRATTDRGGNPKGIEVRRRRTLKPARVVGGVRTHHRKH